MHAEILWIFVGAALLLRFWRAALFLSLCAFIGVILFVLVTAAHWLHLV